MKVLEVRVEPSFGRWLCDDDERRQVKRPVELVHQEGAGGRTEYHQPVSEVRHSGKILARKGT